MDFFTEPFSLDFMRHALLAAVVLGGLCALIGVFVIQRGLSFIGDGLAHASFGGITFALLLGASVDNVLWYALPFTVCIALLVGWVLRRGDIRGDVAVGVFFSVAFALGVVFLSLRKGGQPIQIENLLFGSLLTITPAVLTVLLLVAAATLILIGITWTRLAYATFDPELATLSGIRVAWLEYMLLAATAVVIVVGVKAVGVVLVSSFIVIPAATAKMLGRTLATVSAIAIVVGALTAAAGLFASYHLDVPAGAMIILTLGGLFGIALAFRRRR